MLDLIQEPIEVFVGESHYCTTKAGAKRRLVEKRDSFQYVPLLDSLSVLLKDESVLECIDNPHKRSDEWLEDYCDGELVSLHPFFSDLGSIQIVAYYDELEVCNPLGTHTKKHKLGIVLFTLGNIPPKFRSTLRAINLAVCATRPVIEKHGINAILQPFIRDINTLSSTGITVTTARGGTRKFVGGLLCFVSDNLASNMLGGFKESFSFAYRFCRTCLATDKSFKQHFVSERFHARNDNSHRGHCDDVELLGPIGDYYSKTYGVNCRSSLTKVTHYSLFNGGLPHDMMHDALEGVVQYEIKLLVCHCIDCNYFTLQEYNWRVINFDYGCSENADKPTAIITRDILRSSDKKFHLSSSQALLLCRLLPLIIGDRIPENDLHWKCYLVLLKIMDIVSSPMLSKGHCSVLKRHIQEHDSLFKTLHGESSLTPKFHFFLHYPEQILRLGPMVCCWTMRFESKLQFFKRASHLGNFKNIALTVAQRHQRWLCYQLASGNLLKPKFECGPQKTPTVALYSLPESLATSIESTVPTCSNETEVFNPKWVRSQRNFYCTNNSYIITGSDGLNPIFGKILDIFIVCSKILLLYVQKFTCEYYDEHYHSFVVTESTAKCIVNASDIKQINTILHGHTLFNSNKKLYVMLKNNIVYNY